MLKSLPLIAEHIELDLSEIDFSLSEECEYQLKEIDDNIRTAMIQSRTFYFD